MVLWEIHVEKEESVGKHLRLGILWQWTVECGLGVDLNRGKSVSLVLEKWGLSLHLPGQSYSDLRDSCQILDSCPVPSRGSPSLNPRIRLVHWSLFGCWFCWSER